MSPEARFQKINIMLPRPPRPIATYSSAVRVDRLLYVSGHGPVRNDGTQIRGKVGTDLTFEEASEAARVVGLGILSTVRSTLGSLDKVERLVKVLGFINSSPDFTRHSEVLNGFSDLMVEVFGEAGRGARSAVGTISLPMNIAVEVEAIFEVRD